MKRNRTLLKRRVLWYLSLALLALPANGYAEETNTTYVLDEMVVTANRIETPHEQITSTVSVITRDMIENSTATNVPELLAAVPGVNMLGYGGLGSDNSVNIRVTGGNHTQQVLLLIDGQPANNSFKGGVDWNTIPLANIERIEVVRGPVSALYGDNSLGGAVNIITRKFDKDGGVVEASYGSFETFTTSLVQQGKLNDGGNYILTAGYGNSDGFRDHSDYNGKNMTLRLNMANGVTFSTGYTQYDRANPATVYAKPAKYTSTSLYDGYDFDEVEGHYFDLRKEIKSGIHTTNISANYTVLDSTNIAERLVKSGANWLYTGNWLPSTVLKEKTFGLQLDQSIFVSDKQTLVWGIDYKWLSADGWTYDGRPTSAWSGNPTADESAVYVQDSRKIAEKLTMDIGGRYDHHSAFGGQFSPKFGLAYAVNQDTTFKLNVSRAFKAPTLNDLYGKNGNPDLQPTKAWDYEIGVEKRLDAKTKGTITLYKENIEDLIAGSKRAGQNKSNVDMDAQGIELELAREINEHVGLFFNYTYLDVGDMTRWASRHKGNFGVNYINGAFKASMFEQYAGTSYDEDLHVNPNAAKIDAFMLTNIKITFEPQNSDYAYSFAVNNLFDKDYEYYLYEPMPGRSYTFSVKKKF